MIREKDNLFDSNPPNSIQRSIRHTWTRKITQILPSCSDAASSFWLTFLGDIGKTIAHLVLSVGLHTKYFNQIVMGNFPFGNHKNQQKLDKNQLKFVASPSTSMGSITLLPQPIVPEPSPAFDPSGYQVYVLFCLRRPTLTTNNNSNWIECYDPSNNMWSYVSLIPGIIESHVLNGSAMVSLQDSIYIIGGQLCYKEMVHVSDELAELVDVEVEVLSTVLRYSVRTNQWSTCAPLQTPCWDFACTVCDHKIYVAGGQSTSSSARGIPSAKVYDPNLDERSSLPGMSTSRYKCGGVTWNGKVHMISGYDKRLHSGCAIPFIVEQSSVEVYDPRTGRWELMARMWQLDVPPNQILALDDGRLLSSGDCLMAWKGYIIAYDPQFNLWDIVPRSLEKTLYLQRWPCPMSTTTGYRASGDLPRTVSMVHIFDTSPNVECWRSFEPVEEDREKEFCSHCCVIQLL